MPKRSAQEKIERYNKKILKLQQKVCEETAQEIINVCPEIPVETEIQINESDVQVRTEDSQLQHQPESSELSGDGEATVTTDLPPSEEHIIDPSLLLALGSYDDERPEFGEPIHESLAKIWMPLLKKGLDKVDKDKLIKSILIPSNCTYFQAPKLNAEISAAVSEIARSRDRRSFTSQQQLGTGLAAINRAMHLMLTSDDKAQALKLCSDGCRILSDLHYNFSQERIKLITPNLHRNFLHVIKDSERDESLFGNTLSDKIKASKAIEKQGSQIRKPILKPTIQPSTSGRPNQGNWSAAPPRFQPSRGGRGVHRRPLPSQNRQAYVPAAKSIVHPKSQQTRTSRVNPP